MPIRSASPRRPTTLPALFVIAVCCATAVLGADRAVAAPASQRTPGSAAADEGRDWSAAPSSVGRSGPGREQFYLEGEPGSVLRDTLSLTNDSDRARTFTLRGTGPDGKRSGGAARWVAFPDKGAARAGEVRVPARTRADVPFTVTVPAGATPGDHPSALLVGEGGRDVGVRLQLRVTGPALSALSVEDATVRERDDGATEVAYRLVNRGNTVLRPRLALRADPLFGEATRAGPRALPVELLPGQRVTLREPWRDPPAFGPADVTVAVTADGGAEGEDSAAYTAVPWAALTVTAALLAFGAGGGRWWYVHRARGRRDGTETEAGDAGPPAPDGAQEPSPDTELTTTGAVK
ncbi:hypothetical protein [Streptomyces sp. HNM0574]|uniref:COG1470 family protein n=1 Tax=Streptomyces sp. HNM0574 TaxID=2714954 RepID=UPI00146DF3C7|nr:hypothetical protein [Streptomyces sp. HNM0574]NLU70810.1 hypothetical protein [Streptomyces sp. HNM0574]